MSEPCEMSEAAREAQRLALEEKAHLERLKKEEEAEERAEEEREEKEEGSGRDEWRGAPSLQDEDPTREGVEERGTTGGEGAGREKQPVLCSKRGSSSGGLGAEFMTHEQVF